MVKPSALLLGTRDDAPYHPLGPVESDLLSLFSNVATVTVVTDPEQMTLLNTGGFALAICYADLWERPIPDTALSSLLRFVAGGGSLLVLHNGICLQSRPEFAALVGARFTGHPPAGELAFRITPAGTAMLGEVPSAWTMDEEPYRFEFVGAEPVTLLAEYAHEGVWYPAAWAKTVGQGHLVYLMPGHAREAFVHTDYRTLVRTSAKWLLERPVLEPVEIGR